MFASIPRAFAPVVVIVTAALGVASAAFGQRVTLVDEQVICRLPAMEGGTIYRAPLWAAKLSPDGKTIVYGEWVGDPPPPGDRRGGDRQGGRAQFVIRRLDTAPGAKNVEFRPDVGPTTGADVFSLLDRPTQPFSPNGKLLLLPDCTKPEPPGGEKRRPILVCETETGRIARTDIRADLRYGRIDASNHLLLYMSGQAYSLETGKRVKQFGYMGFVEAASPVAPLALVNTGIEGTPDTPNRVLVWNLRDDRLLATLPTNFRHPYTDDVSPEWTSDGTYIYFVDVTDEKDPERPRITKVWNVKTGQLVGQPFREAIPMGPGPLPGTMFLRQWRGEETAHVLHDAESGARVELPLKFDAVKDALGDKVAYVKSLDGNPHLCVATVKWDLPGKPAAVRLNRTRADGDMRRKR
ncbi:MAG: hypothetical protein WBD40_00950 [Tepidisphaeraceae bacterium]